MVVFFLPTPCITSSLLRSAMTKFLHSAPTERNFSQVHIVAASNWCRTCTGRLTILPEERRIPPVLSGKQRLYHSHLPQVPWLQILIQENRVSNINRLPACTRSFYLISTLSNILRTTSSRKLAATAVSVSGGFETILLHVLYLNVVVKEGMSVVFQLKKWEGVRFTHSNFIVNES